jgi:uncharacterized membrane protein required for colicin V production
MGFLPSWLNPFDVFIALALLAGIALGFIRGLVRMALSLLILYIATVLAMTFYSAIGGWFRHISGGILAKSTAEVIAFGLVLLLTTAIITFVLRRTYKDTELPGVRQIDQLGGMIVGFVLTCTWIGLALVAIGFVLNATDTTTSSLRDNILAYYHGSALIRVFQDVLPIILVTLRPWMPKGLPPDIFSRRYF